MNDDRFDEQAGGNGRTGQKSLNRRGFLKFGVAAGVAGLLPATAWAKPNRAVESAREIAFYNTHTGEKLKLVYSMEGAYIPEALSEINYVLRDHYSDAVGEMDARVLDLLYELKLKLRTREPFHIISAYRSPETNARLAERSGGVAKRSLHMHGMAIDVRVPGRDLAQVRKAAMALQGGGVGYYRGPNFVHLDTGRVRYW
ncbi:MAG: DUF882 domain-containing protein [Gammaproteobacteria bacterium]|nr:MAG: DUF882 domain-containing protein [Gammaproteobacteria bacterium]